MNARIWAAVAALGVSGTVLAGLPSAVSQARSADRTPDDLLPGRVSRLERQVADLHREVERLKAQPPPHIITSAPYPQLVPNVPSNGVSPDGMPPNAVPFKKFNGTQYYIYPLKKGESGSIEHGVIPLKSTK